MDYIFVLLWTVVIYATVPYAQKILYFLGSHFGGDKNIGNGAGIVLLMSLAGIAAAIVKRSGIGVLWGLAAGTGLAAILYVCDARPLDADNTLTHLAKGLAAIMILAVGRLMVAADAGGKSAVLRGVWFAAALTGYAYFMTHIEIASEKIHFLEYGLLAVLLFRALRHHIANPIIYVYVLAIGYAIGLSDELLQTLIASRVAEIDDTLWNLASVILAIAALAMAWQPDGIDRRATRRHVWGALALLSVTIVSGGFFVQHFTDFGYRIDDREIGSFNCAFPLERQILEDRARGAEAAALMDVDEDTTYRKFIERYSMKTDPYLHQARVHIFRRDKYLLKMRTEATTLDLRLKYMHVAVMENRILDKYYPALMAATERRRWTHLKAEFETELAANQALKPDYESAVGKRMITAFDRRKFWGGLLSAIAALFFTAVFCARRITAPEGETNKLTE